MKVNNVADLIGDTPLVKIDYSTHGLDNINLYAKMELLNPFGSVKDRIGKTMYWDAKKDIDQDTVIESSSGNTAKALCSLTQDTHDFETVTNRIKLDYIKDLLEVIGADITEVPGSNECPDPTNPENPNEIIKDMVREHPNEYYHTDQYFTDKNPAAHEQTGDEILDDLKTVDIIAGDLGTSGTTRGIGRRVREQTSPSPEIHGVITEAQGYVPGGRNRNELFETGLFDKDFYDAIHEGSTQGAIDGMLDLIRKEGILCGPTTGLVYSAITSYLKGCDNELDVVFIACDRMEPYVEYLKKNRPSIFTDKNTNKSLPEAQHMQPESIPNEAICVDTRVPYAYRRKPFPQSINIPLKQLESMLQQSPPFTDEQPIVLVCPEGQKTTWATRKLRWYGIEAYNLDGGMNSYIDAQG